MKREKDDSVWPPGFVPRLPELMRQTEAMKSAAATKARAARKARGERTYSEYYPRREEER